MLTDAIRSELYRFSRNNTVWIWGLLVVPVASAIAGVVQRQFILNTLEKARGELPPELMAPDTPLALLPALANQASGVAGINLLAFFLIAAAVIAASDYRWESWRLLRPRNSRSNLILGKAATIAILAIIPIALHLILEIIGQIISASIENRAITVGGSMKLVGNTLLMIGVGWMRTVQVAFLALLASIVTRSMFGGLIAAVAVIAGTFMVERMMMAMGWEPGSWRMLLLFPAGAHDLLQAALAGANVSGAQVFRALLGLILWLVGPLTLSVWLFNRQDINKE